ncbi:MAG: hypothetical protein COB02_06180 [Candidatus Cloacimonadota bacterium]|nr:MAG: hypothetical protein COB02_06180 [Candidatus Cloacimonadota bacterium]
MFRIFSLTLLFLRLFKIYGQLYKSLCSLYSKIRLQINDFIKNLYFLNLISLIFDTRRPKTLKKALKLKFFNISFVNQALDRFTSVKRTLFRYQKLL